MVGYISAKMDDLNILLNELESPTPFSRYEMQHMRDRIASIDAAVRAQHKEIESPLVRPKLTQYETMWRIAIDYLSRREDRDGRPVEEHEARRAARWRSADMELYASDRRGPVPLEEYRPADANDLRHILPERSQGGGWRALDEPTTSRGQRRPRHGEPILERTLDRANELRYERRRHESVQQPLYGGAENQRPYVSKRTQNRSDVDSMERPAVRRRSFSELSTTSESSIETPPPSSVRSAISGGSSVSRVSYASSAQRVGSRPMNQVAFPPVRNELPYPIRADDPSLIGVTEIFTHPPDRSVAPHLRLCPLCGEDHRLIRCRQFDGLTLMDRWFQALSLGVCLHCLRRGHSSFTCYLLGSCGHCRKRHNSLLCPKVYAKLKK